MKKSRILFGLIAVAAIATAAPIDWFFGMDKDRDKKVSEDEWVAGNRADNLRKGWTFNEERSRAQFKTRDLDQDGFMTKEEFKATMKNKKTSK